VGRRGACAPGPQGHKDRRRVDLGRARLGGVPGHWLGEVEDRLNGAARMDLRDEGVRKRFPELGLELPDEAMQSPTALGELVRNEIDRWVAIIKKAGVVAQ
jgi:hypothetical protein